MTITIVVAVIGGSFFLWQMGAFHAVRDFIKGGGSK